MRCTLDVDKPLALAMPLELQCVAFFGVLGRARKGAQGDLLRATVDGVEASLAAFLAAGLLEWNLGDSEILALLCFLVGTAIAAGRLGGAGAPAPVT